MKEPSTPADTTSPGDDAGAVPGARRGSRGPGLPAAATAVAAPALAVVVAGCSSFELSGPPDLARMQLDLEVPGVSASSSVGSAPAVRPSVTVSDPGSSLSFTVDSVDLVLREIQAGQEGAECLFAGAGGTDGGDGSSCEEFSTGTIVQTLPVDDGANELTIIRLEPGTWDHLAFQFNVLEQQQSEDVQILGDRPDMLGASVFVQTTINGGDGDPGNDQVVELRLAPDGARVLTAPQAVTLASDEQGLLTFTIDVGTWFDDGSGGVLDPAEVAGSDTQKSQVEANIDASLGVEVSGP